MLAVPVAWLGAVLIHGAVDLPMSFQSVIGMIAASGVVVNDSIVLLDYIQKRKGEEVSLHEVIVEACTSRFRPIVLVALTNLAGFLPMLFETSEQAEFSGADDLGTYFRFAVWHDGNLVFDSCMLCHFG